jgi:hypothetical protein
VTDPDPNAAGGTQVDVPNAGYLADTCGARVIQQGDLNLCGPAAHMSRWAYRDPVAFATFATQLFETGKSQIGSLAIAPGSDLLGADYNAMLAKMVHVAAPQADWMFLSALRNTTNLFWQPSFVGDPSQQVAAMTLASQLTSWFSATGMYAKVDDQTNMVEEKGVEHAIGLDNLPGQDIVLLINANLIALAEKGSPDSGWIVNQFPNHYVGLLNAPTLSADQTTITLNVWTWGRSSRIGSTPDPDKVGQTVDVAVADFIKNYYGAIVATMTPPSSP